jgi:FtsZ-binding cell division protein ZapB
MKRTLVLFTLIGCVCGVYAQQDSLLVEKITRQAIEIDSLKKELAMASKTNEDMSFKCQSSLIQQKDTIKLLRKEVDELIEFKSKKQGFDNQLQTQTDAVASLNKQLSEEKQNSRQKASEERERGKGEALSLVVSTYKISRFDDLTHSSSKESVQRDKQLVGDNPEIKTTLDDLYKYFSAQELLSKKYDESRVKDAQLQLEQVTQKSAKLDKLKETLGNFQTFNEGMKETIKNIVDLDNRETVEGMSDEIRQKKFNKILAEISAYIFNYDFNFSDYPYLSDILLEIFKRKQPDADADITDLLENL